MELTTSLQENTDLGDLRNMQHQKLESDAQADNSERHFILINFFLKEGRKHVLNTQQMYLCLPMFLSTPAATAAKLGEKLGAVESGLWHRSLRYKLFVLNRAKQWLLFNICFLTKKLLITLWTFSTVT